MKNNRVAAPLLLLVLVTAITSPSLAEQRLLGMGPAEIKEYDSQTLQGKIITYPTVFPPGEAERIVLPLMKLYPELFEGKTVLEIGTGSGIISVYAAKLGATRVVSTDINPNALRSLEENSVRQGVGERIDPRLVSEDDMSAFAVIKANETFDTIISNPPYALNLDAETNSPATDRGDLGLSIVNGLDKHLNPTGSVVLYYGSLYYHGVMVKYARHMGYEVRSHIPAHMVPWEARTLFNFYTRRLLKSKDLPLDLFEFKTWELRGIKVAPRKGAPLFPESDVKRQFPGFLVIEHQRNSKAEIAPAAQPDDVNRT